MMKIGRVLAAFAVVSLTLTACGAAVSDTADRSFFSAVQAAMAAEVPSAASDPNAEFGMWWITRDHHAIINDDAVAYELQSAVCETDDAKQSKYKALVTRLRRAVGVVMQEQGFALNVRNSSRSLADDRFYDYVQAYERSGVQAVMSASPDCWSQSDTTPMHYSVFFAYTTNLAANRAAQLPYLRDLNLGSDVIVHVTKRVGKWVDIAVNYRRSGHEVIAQFANGTWRQVWAGQDLPTCAFTSRLKIPKTITDCYDDAA